MPQHSRNAHPSCLLCAGSELRYGTVRYEHLGGNTVRFIIETQWRRGMAFPGTGQDNLAMQGDVVEVVGDARSPVGPVMFETGDGQRYHITMTVTESSASEDFVHGYTRITHSYTSATNGARPWSAALKGCCRQGSGTTFELTTKLDLSIPAGAGSPAHKALPMVTVGKHPDMPSAVVAVPVSTPGGERARYWRLGQGSELGSLVRRDPSEVFFNTTDYLDGKLTVNTSALEPGVFSLVVQASLGAAIVPLDFKVAVLSPEETLQRPVLRVQVHTVWYCRVFQQRRGTDCQHLVLFRAARRYCQGGRCWYCRAMSGMSWSSHSR